MAEYDAERALSELQAVIRRLKYPRMLGMYRLEGHMPVLCECYELHWARVRHTRVGPYRVSTVFLGIDHRWSGQGRPILFETMVFGPDDDTVFSQWDGRSCTWEEAEVMHLKAIDGLLSETCPGESVAEIPEEPPTTPGSSPGEPPPGEQL